MGLFSSMKEIGSTIANSKPLTINKAIWDQEYGKGGLFRTSDGSFNWGSIPFVGQSWTNERNLQWQRDQQEYQRNLQERMFDREDSSIARRTADLQRSGLSPVLAAGQGAGTGPVVNSQSISSKDISGSAMDVLAMMRQVSDMSTAQKQRQIMDSQERLLQAQTNVQNWEATRRAHDWAIYDEAGIMSNSSGLASQLANALSFFTKSPVLEGAKKEISNKIDAVNNWINSKLNPQKPKAQILDEQQQYYLNFVMELNKKDRVAAKKLLDKLIQEGKLPK